MTSVAPGRRVVPMLHVPDIAQTADWYQSIGLAVVDIGYDGDQAVWAMVALGDSAVMFNVGGQRSAAHRREVDLYVYVDDVEAWFDDLHDRVELVEGLHQTFYGMREFIIRDVNRFWITFGQRCSSARAPLQRPRTFL